MREKYTSRSTAPLRLPKTSTPHRIACFALYRALLLLAPTISLPLNTPPTRLHPLTWQVRKAFRRHTAQTSKRGIASALAVGYAAHRLFHAAAAGQGIALQQVHSLLGLQEAARDLSRAQPRPVRAERPRVWAHSEDKIEDVRPRKQEQLGGSGRRRIPIPTQAAAAGVPFLRFGGTQSPYLGRVIRDLADRRRKRVLRLEGAEEWAEYGGEEDKWEAMLEGMGTGFRGDGGWEREGLEEMDRLEKVGREWDGMAERRGQAMVRIVEGEMEAWERERLERKRTKRERKKGGLGGVGQEGEASHKEDASVNTVETVAYKPFF